MHKPVAGVAVAFQHNIMDKTLADYIKRTQEKLEKDQSPTPENQYPVYPEKDETDAKRNPYSPV